MIDRAAAQAAAAGLTADVRPHLKKFESKIEMDKSGAVGTPAWYGAVHYLHLLSATLCHRTPLPTLRLESSVGSLCV